MKKVILVMTLIFCPKSYALDLNPQLSSEISKPSSRQSVRDKIVVSIDEQHQQHLEIQRLLKIEPQRSNGTFMPVKVKRKSFLQAQH